MLSSYWHPARSEGAKRNGGFCPLGTNTSSGGKDTLTDNYVQCDQGYVSGHFQSMGECSLQYYLQ